MREKDDHSGDQGACAVMPGNVAEPLNRVLYSQTVNIVAKRLKVASVLHQDVNSDGV